MDESQHPGPLFKIGSQGLQMRDDDQIYYDKDLGYYGPGKCDKYTTIVVVILSKPMLRKAGEFVDDPEIFQTIFKHLKTDGVPDQAANQMTAEMVTSGEDFDSSIERYQTIFR